MIPSEYQINRRALAGTVGQTNDSRLLLEYQKDLNNIEHDRQSRKRILLP